MKQAPTLLHSHFAAIKASMGACLLGMIGPAEKVVLARNIAMLATVFSTTKRGDELTRILIQRIRGQTNNSCHGLISNGEIP